MTRPRARISGNKGNESCRKIVGKQRPHYLSVPPSRGLGGEPAEDEP